jgi:methylated-DNA-[protein]-cysteine S-methyltransferase
MSSSLFRSTLETPFGDMQIGVDEEGVLVEVRLPNRGPFRASRTELPAPAMKGMDAARTQLLEYFGGRRRTFDLPLEARGTEFERAIWERLRSIPYGATTSYGAIAAELGLINGARAVGRANGANPIPIVIPCHRVIGTNGELTGFGGGLPLKRALLEFEGAIPPEPLRLLSL